MRWTIKEKKTVLKTYPFDVEELFLQEKDSSSPGHPYYRLKCADWINVLPITRDGKAVLIRQSRIGSESNVLETPGGIVNLNEAKDPTLTVVRELEEETGYTSRRVIPLLSINPNPAIQTNKLHLFLALDCELNPQRKHFPDEDEKIEVVLEETNRLEELVRLGRIDHALAALCIMLAGKYVRIS